MEHIHDFKNFPELTNRQLEEFYFDSPHKQILDDFRARVIQVTDGDTIRVEWSERNFSFPIRLANLAAPEIKEKGGPQSQKWLEGKILNKDIDIALTRTRVEKWGRLLAYVIFDGINISEEIINNGFAVSWQERLDTLFPNLELELKGFEE